MLALIHSPNEDQSISPFNRRDTFGLLVRASPKTLAQLKGPVFRQITADTHNILQTKRRAKLNVRNYSDLYDTQAQFTGLI